MPEASVLLTLLAHSSHPCWVYRDYIGIAEKKIETTRMVALGLYGNTGAI